MMKGNGFGSTPSWPSFKVLSRHLSGGTKETTKNLSQYSRCPGRDLKPRSQILMLFSNEVAISEATRVKSDKTIQ
jgi:hypothetical protein